MISSYFCARTSLAQQLAPRMAEEILCPSPCTFYASNGDLSVYPEHAQSRSRQEVSIACCPSAPWLEAITHDDFYRLYCRKLPGAVDWKQRS